MNKIIIFLMTLILVISLSACSGSNQTSVSTSTDAQTSEIAYVVSQDTTSETTEVGSAASTTTDIQVEYSETHEDGDDYVWDSAAVIPITLNGDSISVDGAGVSVNGSTATITSAGTYSLTGTHERWADHRRHCRRSGGQDNLERRRSAQLYQCTHSGQQC